MTRSPPARAPADRKGAAMLCVRAMSCRITSTCGLPEIDLNVESYGANPIVGRQSMSEWDRPIMTARPQLPERTPRNAGVPTALDGLLVVDFTRVVAGPACTQTLAA